MANLYTHILKGHNRRLQILSRLKYLYRCSPVDYNEVEELREELHKIESKESPPKRKILVGIFNKL